MGSNGMLFSRFFLFTTVFLLPLIAVRADEATDADQDNWLWFSETDLHVRGQGWQETSSPFTRLPDRAQELVRPPVWNLSRDSAGLYLQFTTDAPTLRVRWTLLKERLAMNHMPATGVSGLDLYVRHENKWRFLAVGRPGNDVANDRTLFKDLPAETREFRLYFPLYNGIKSIEIGIPTGYTLEDSPQSDLKPVVLYGTSILQGGCASRPGMAYPAILGRRFDDPLINLGFSGNGRGEPEVAELIAELDPSLFVLDPLPNIAPSEVSEKLTNFVKILREKHPETPILLVESVAYTTSFLIPSRANRYQTSNARLREVFEQLIEEGDENLYYFQSENLLGEDGEDTVDGTHPTDLGFLRMADGLEPAIREILNTHR
ncbi:MAG TPA: SGNH/GDSL hydrolase family protein [Opitutales bacterium]|nr:SGNH/GDSL hydrolase family protein [Opitutales bacterium]